MLEGWTMLSITCPMPSCKNCVLLSDKSVSDFKSFLNLYFIVQYVSFCFISFSSLYFKGTIQCACCKQMFVRESDTPNFLSAPPLQEEGDLSSSRQDAATSLMSDLLLRGWAMLAETCEEPGCPGIPLLRKRGTQIPICVYCNPNLASAEVSTPGLPPSDKPLGISPPQHEPSAVTVVRDTSSSPQRAATSARAASSDTAWQKVLIVS